MGLAQDGGQKSMFPATQGPVHAAAPMPPLSAQAVEARHVSPLQLTLAN